MISLDIEQSNIYIFLIFLQSSVRKFLKFVKMSAPFYHVPVPGLSCDVPVGSDQDPDPPTKDSDPAADKRLSDGLLNRHRFSPSHKGSMRKEDFIYIWYKVARQDPYTINNSEGSQ